MAIQGAPPTPSKPAPDPKDVYTFSFRTLPGNPPSGVSLLDLLKQFSHLVPGSYILDDDVAQALERMIMDIHGAVIVPKSSAGEFLESALAAHGFALVEVGRPSLGLRKVCVAPGLSGDPIRGAVVIDANEIDAYAGRGATVVTTVVPVRHSSAAAICKAVNGEVYFPSTMTWGSPVPMGDHCILVSGLAPDVAKLVKFIANADRAEKEVVDARASYLRVSIAELDARVKALEEKGAASRPGGK